MTGSVGGVPRILLVVVGCMLMAGLVSLVVTPSIWTARNVPPELRDDRWELSYVGSRVRSRTEDLCGEMSPGVWIDQPSNALLPVILGASHEQRACFDARVAPAFETADPLEALEAW